MRVTFDSNVFQPTVRPDLFPQDPDKQAFEKVLDAIQAKRVIPFIAEAMFDLEGIMKRARPSHFGNPKVETKVTEREINESVGASISLGPASDAHPGLAPILADRLNEAFALGFKVLYCPRIGLGRAPELGEAIFEVEPTDAERGARQERYHNAGRAIEAQGVGIAHLKALGQSIGTAEKKVGPWYRMLPLAKEPQQLTAIAKGVAEWADADAISAHIGYQNDFFCSRDVGNSAGSSSVFDQANRQWLEHTFGVQFVTPAQLAAKL